MEKFELALGAIVAFLLPVGIYCLMLASINRRVRPTMVGGAWDAAGLLFATSGFLFITAPMLLYAFYQRVVESADGDHIDAVWLRHTALSVVYYLVVISGIVLLLLSRGNKTMIYNVDLELFPKALDRAFARLGLEANRSGSRLVVTPLKVVVEDGNTAFMETSAKLRSEKADHRHAELQIDVFSSMCHVTLLWGKCSPNARQEIEAELHKSLENGAPLENPAAGWFLSVSGLILGAVTAIALAWMFLAIVAHR